MIAHLLAVLGLLTVLFAAPLTLGTFVIVQHTAPRLLLLWFGLLTLLFAITLGAGALGLLLLAL